MSTQPMTHEQAIDLAALYVLGALEAADMASVREHLATCPESHAEFEELGGVVPYLLEMPDLELVEPPGCPARPDHGGRGRAISRPARRRRTCCAADPAPAGPPIAFPSAPQSARPAPVLGRAGSAGRCGSRRSSRSSSLAAGTSSSQNELNARADSIRPSPTVISAAAEPGSKTVVLAPGENSQAERASRRCDRTARSCSRCAACRPRRASEVYETWVIVPDAAPLAVGGFTVDANGVATFTTRAADAPPGATIAVTREPKAGNTAPEGPVVSAGVAVGSDDLTRRAAQPERRLQ